MIIEYKRSTNENVINQGLFYLDWLLDHRGDYKVLVIDHLAKEEADKIDWSGPRLICIAADFTRYDMHAVQQINRNIDLVRYRKFSEEFLALELVHSVTSADPIDEIEGTSKPKAKVVDYTVTQAIVDLEQPLCDVYDGLRAYVLALGDDVTEKTTKLYVAFRRIKNFACVTVGKSALSLYLKLDPTTVALEDGFTRDVREIGHWGTGDLEAVVRDVQSLEKSKVLLEQCYLGA